MLSENIDNHSKKNQLVRGQGLHTS